VDRGDVPPIAERVYSLGENNRVHTIVTGLGRYDGVESLQDGRLVVASWSDSTVQIVGRDGKAHRLISNVWQPADLGWDPTRKRILVPTVLQGRVDIWELQ
jgi:hypothetical protein